MKPLNLTPSRIRALQDVWECKPARGAVLSHMPYLLMHGLVERMIVDRHFTLTDEGKRALAAANAKRRGRA